MATERKSTGTWHIHLWQDTPFDRVLYLKDENGDPLNLTTYTDGVMKIRSLDGTVSIEFSVSNGDLILGGAAGTVTLQKTAAQMAAANVPLSTQTFRYEHGAHVVDAAGKIIPTWDGTVKVDRVVSLV